ncbi:hypothetical protein [Brevibacillus sp. Leaf182]|uniref:hypothetical protein n=1 Tax=Brevibacillus sp. Leaf182 TaxID=1736290 RepID=UPI0006F5F918|nr:hypothetical protein [Brevibacillus sp. Leaf182]RAT96987.1 hypothetical protein ASG16_014985 [Brevibacillus sp. Leaf182]
MSDLFIGQIESKLATIVRMFAMEGLAREVAVLANSSARVEQTDYDNWNGGIYYYTLFLELPINLYVQIKENTEEIEKKIKDELSSVINSGDSFFERVTISPILSDDKDWRSKANTWLNGSNISNQGRVRSSNIASRNCDGLLFRSQAEIKFYKALKKLGVSFAPLPVFIKGGTTYQRIEPDFVIIKDGIVAVVEVDGDTVHQETPAEAHTRTTMLLHEGVHFERIKASECDTEENALSAAKRIVSIIEKIKNVR